VNLLSPDGYYVNRALLVGLGCAAIAIAFWRLRRPEVLLGEEA
jgi:hypothetical protein